MHLEARTKVSGKSLINIDGPSNTKQEEKKNSDSDMELVIEYRLENALKTVNKHKTFMTNVGSNVKDSLGLFDYWASWNNLDFAMNEVKTKILTKKRM